MQKRGTEDKVAVRNRRIRVLCCQAAAWSHVISGSELPLRAVSGSVTLLKQGSVLMAVVRVTTQGHGIAGPGPGRMAPITSHCNGRIVPTPYMHMVELA